MGNCLAAKDGFIKPHKKGSSSYVKSRANVSSLNAQYNINKKCLGKGSFGKVFLATNKHDEEMQVAIKVINKTGLKE